MQIARDMDPDSCIWRKFG